MINAEQVRAARALLRLEQSELARKAHVSVSTIRRLESVAGEARVAARALSAIKEVLELNGIEFIEDGVRKRVHRGDDRESLRRALRAIAEQSAKLQSAIEPKLTEADFYDEAGLPA